jgi:hypothetical protein
MTEGEKGRGKRERERERDFIVGTGSHNYGG